MSIRRYLEQLVADVRLSAQNRDKNIEYDPILVVAPPNLPDHLKHLPVVPAQPIYKWMRLDPEAFPPAEKFENEEELIFFCSLLRQLFEHYHYQIQLPCHLPFAMTYEYLIKAFYAVESCSEESSNLISFCTGDEDTCPFGDYCSGPDDCYQDSWLIQFWEGYELSRKIF
ncbi:MAG TPA: hypothetical protein VHO90_03045 [Bacteroidales bacterium]|nr:hypothetical protein [Bacteroidales bacterium]